MPSINTARQRRARLVARQDSRKDWWDKASIVSSFLGSVVVVLVGVLISFTIQQAQIRASAANTKAQIDAAALQAREQQRLQESQLTAQLLQHLISKEATQREIAIVALRNAVPATTYDSIVEALARSDSSSVVRAAAIRQLGNSGSPTAPNTLNAIVLDRSRPEKERQLAAESTVRIGARETIESAVRTGSSLVVLAASAADEQAFEMADDEGRISGVFTRALLSGLRGTADLNHDGLIFTSELRSYVAVDVARQQPFQAPVALSNASEHFPVAVTFSKRLKPEDAASIQPNGRLPYRATRGLFVGTFSRLPRYPILPAAVDDARAAANAFTEAAMMSATVLLGDKASEAQVAQAWRQAELTTQDEDLFVFYYAGTGIVTGDGSVRWLLADSNEAGGLTPQNIGTALSRVRARHKVVIIDSSHAGGIAQVGGLKTE